MKIVKVSGDKGVIEQQAPEPESRSSGQAGAVVPETNGQSAVSQLTAEQVGELVFAPLCVIEPENRPPEAAAMLVGQAKENCSVNPVLMLCRPDDAGLGQIYRGDAETEPSEAGSEFLVDISEFMDLDYVLDFKMKY